MKMSGTSFLAHPVASHSCRRGHSFFNQQFTIE